MRRASLTLVLVVVAWARGAAAQEYTAVRLTSPDGHVLGTAMNELGQVAGVINEATGNVLFLSTRGVITEYPLIAGIVPEVSALNNAGTLVGSYSFDNGGGRRSIAYKMQNGQITALGTFGGDNSFASAIDDSGRIVGAADGFTFTSHAFLSVNGTLIDLGTFPGGTISQAIAVAIDGPIAGLGNVPDVSGQVFHGFLYSSGVKRDLGTFVAHGSTIPYTMNASGTIVGSATVPGFITHAFSWSAGHLTDLGTLGGAQSSAYGINLAGDIVGDADLPGAGGTHAFVMRRGIMSDLNGLVSVPGDVLTSAGAINAAGQILAQSATSTYLLSPVQTNRFAYAWVESQTNASSYTTDPAYSFNASGGPILVNHLGTGNYDVEFVGFAFGPGVSSSIAVTPFGATNISCSILPYATEPTSARVNVACHDRVTWQPADSIFNVLIMGNGSLSIPSGFVTSVGGPAPVPAPDPQSVWGTGRLPVTVTHNAPVGDYSVLFGTGNTPLSAKLVTSTGGAAQCTYAEGVSGGIRVRCYTFAGALLDSGFSVLQIGTPRTGKRLGFATANLSTTASYAPASNSAFNSTGGAITASRSSVGRYRMVFDGLQRFPGHTENVQVSMIGTLPYACNATGWGSFSNGLFVDVECRNQSGQLVDVRYNVAVIE